MYHFVDLTEEQKHRRRLLLDWYGLAAQLSILVPLLVLQLYFLGSYITRRWLRASSVQQQGSPYLKAKRASRPAALARAWTWFLWWSGEPVDFLGVHLGSKGPLLAAIAWAAWLLVLCFSQTGQDYLHVTKRFAIVAASQLPLHYLLAWKAPVSPLQVLTRTSHETLICFHQLLGRIVTLLFYLHAIFYVNFYVLSGLLTAKLKEAYVLCGVAGILALTIVGTTAMAPVRRWNYRVFYFTHVILATALLPILFFHVSHIRPYLYESALVYALSAVFRHYSSRTLSGTLSVIPDTSLIDMRFRARSKDDLARWEAGQHAYISLPSHPLFRSFRSNPFTLASIPAVDTELRFVARVLEGNTVKLAHAADKSDTEHQATIEGPYGTRNHADRLLQHERVLLVAGGVGGTFIAPLYRQLLQDLSPSTGSHRRQRVRLVWVVRRTHDMEWALPEDVREREGFLERLKVYHTGSGHGDDHDQGVSREDNGDAVGEEAIELEEQSTLLKGNESADDNKNVTTFSGRPDLAQLVAETFMHKGSDERVAIMVCGPASLSRDLRREVGRWVKKGRHVWYHEEAFDL